MTDSVRRYVQNLLEAPFRAEEERLRRAREIVRSGRPVVEGGRTSATAWELHDWLTGAVIARGDDGEAGLTAALAGTYHADGLYAEPAGPGPETSAVPPSLGRALEEWAVAPETPDEEIAAFVGWPVARVREHR